MDDPKVWTMYVILCEDNSFYAGITKNLAHRLEQHKKGDGSKYVWCKKFDRVLYSRDELTHSDALRLEVAFKRLNRKKKEVALGWRGAIPEIWQKGERHP